MCQPRRHLDLAEEPLGTDLCRDIRAEYFYRDRPFVTQVAGEKNDGHAPFTEEAFYIIAAGETGFEALLKLNHDSQYWSVHFLAARAKGLGPRLTRQSPTFLHPRGRMNALNSALSRSP